MRGEFTPAATAANARLSRFGALASACALLLSACAAREVDPSELGMTTLQADRAAVAQSDKVVALFPGALNGLDYFGSPDRWTEAGYAVVAAPMPGLDGAPLKPLKLRAAARDVAALLRTAPGARLRLLGFSTGASLALETAAVLGEDRDVRVAVVGALPGFPAAFRAGLRTSAAMLGVMIDQGSTDLGAAWNVYYPTLLFGREGAKDPANRARAQAIRAARAGGLVKPSVAMLRAQVGDVAWWNGRLSGPIDHVPTLFLHGADDPVVPLRAARRFAEIAPDRRFEAAPGRGHLLLRTDPDLLDVVLAFFDADDLADFSAAAARPALSSE